MIRRGYQQLRKGRWSGRHQVYHLMFVTVAREPIFNDFALARLVILALKREQDRCYVESLTFVVMPDHVHWLVKLCGDKDLSAVVNNVKSRTARKINAIRDTRGQIWQKGFYDRAIRRDEDIEDVARYIVANPIRSGLVRSIRDYPHWDAMWL